MTDQDGEFPTERLWAVSVDLVRSLEAAVHFIENVDKLTGNEPESPWPGWYQPGYVGLLDSLAKWYELLTGPTDPV